MRINKNPDVYCREWMNDNSGIAEDNFDEAPSLYADNVYDAASMLDLTSVSRNRYPPLPKENKGRQMNISTGSLPSNVQFM